MKPVFFSEPSEFRKWLEKNHSNEKELLVGFYKVNSGKPSMTWSQSVDQALCFGWIDGVRRSIDNDSYLIRFTPRKASSIWSAVNIKKVEELTRNGLMHEAGLAVFKNRLNGKSKLYSYEKTGIPFSPEYEKLFKANKKAWVYFQSLAPSYRKTSTHWVMSAKHKETQIKRLKILIANSESGMNQWKDNKYAKKK